MHAPVQAARTQEAQWQAAQLDRLPDAWRIDAARGHDDRLAAARALPAGRGLQTEAIAAAHAWLRGLADLSGGLRVPAGLTDAELCDLAAANARECLDLAGATWPYIMEAIRARLERFVVHYGLPPPAPEIEAAPAVARMTDAAWWRRGLRVTQARRLEAAAIHMGRVHRRAEPYASNATVARRAQQRRRNQAALESTEALNLDTGEVLRLADLAAASVANPRIRRGELMTRIAGFERVATALGHFCAFVTVTCPSRFHAKTVQAGRVMDNPRYDGATPREAQGHLSRLWANLRARLHRLGLALYGFRIAEPHHDATPHWHLLLFCPRDRARDLRREFRRYALRESADEPGARRRRLTFRPINLKHGSAAGYVAKYVSKNIDGGGYQVQSALEGMEAAIHPAERVDAWAATWGIRQFQQLGGPPVGVWRELRRLPAGGDYAEHLEAARQAADCGPRRGYAEERAAAHWARYVAIQGGPTVARRALALCCARTRAGERWDYARALPYAAPPTRYGELAPPAVFGVWDRKSDRAHATARARWTLRRSGRVSGPWTRVNNCSPTLQEAPGHGPHTGFDGPGRRPGGAHRARIDPAHGARGAARHGARPDPGAIRPGGGLGPPC